MGLDNNIDTQRTTLQLNGKGIDKTIADEFLSRKLNQTYQLSTLLANYAKQIGDKHFEKRFRNTYFCLKNLKEHDGKYYGNRCKNRFCKVCQDFKGHRITQKYQYQIQNWHDAHLVTLTTKEISVRKLDKRIKRVTEVFKQILDNHRQHLKRGRDSVKISCIRSIECSINVNTNRYMVHFHIVAENKEIGDFLIKEWVMRLPNITKKRSQQNQEISKKTVNTTMRYLSKFIFNKEFKDRFFSDSLYQEKAIPMLYNIVRVFNGKQIVTHYGLEEVNIQEKSQTSITTEEYLNKIFNPHLEQWIDVHENANLCK